MNVSKAMLAVSCKNDTIAVTLGPSYLLTRFVNLFLSFLVSFILYSRFYLQSSGSFRRQYYTVEKSPEKQALNKSPVSPRAKAEASQFTRLFLTVYCLVMGSDWLQGKILDLSLRHYS